MVLKEIYIERMIDRMSRRERKEFVEKIIDRFFLKMGPEEKRELLASLIPRIIDQMTGDLEPDERKEVMREVLSPLVDQGSD
ncbi:MAG: hypothetical protein ACLFUV_03630 [Methanomassiliicoccales archaeon]